MVDKRKVPNGATSYADITPLNPEWGWLGRIPMHELTIIAGDGGIGKGFLMAELVARITRGARMPDGTPGFPTGSVIMVTVEDDPNMAMAYRLRAAGADLSKVYDMTTDDFVIPDALPALRETIDAIGDVRAVILDPLSAVSSIPITSGNVRIRRKLMMPMERLAKDTGVALLAVHHTVKSGRTAGAKAITDTARMVLRVYRSPNDDRVRVISVDKSNIASDGIADVAYTVAGTWPDVKVTWLAMPEDGATDRPEPSTADRIMSVLADMDGQSFPDVTRADDGSVHAQDIARVLSVPYGTVRVALTRLKDAGQVIPGSERGRWRERPTGELVSLPTVDAK